MLVVLLRAKHDHAAVERQLGVGNGAIGHFVNSVALKTEDVREPFNGGLRVKVTKRGYDGGFGVRRGVWHVDLLFACKRRLSRAGGYAA